MNAERKRNPVSVHEHSHLHDRIRTVFLGRSVLPHTLFLFNFEVIIGAVVIEYFVVPLSRCLAEFVQRGLNEILLLSDYFQRAVNILQRIGGRFQQSLRIAVSRQLGAWLQNPSVYQMCKDIPQRVRKSIFLADLLADIIQSQFVKYLLQKQISAVEQVLSILFN